eukprot:TRINITY_DN44555_c0_g1_i1.p1 TRINITY_DN44555_c0_g1~~TRINITY_DN44555_c0_g1_i1.p1  ORF type:complete len:464 (+),score=138.23 TRINITY_DN44555_c0_g1_i1:78-1469(+)
MSLVTLNNMVRRGLHSVERRGLTRTTLGLPDDGGKAKERLKWTARIRAVRQWNEHHRVGRHAKVMMAAKSRLFKTMYRKQKGAKQRQLFIDFPDLKQVESSHMAAESGLMLTRLHIQHTKIEMEMMRIFQQCTVEQFREKSYSLTVTILYFADISSVMIVLNMHPTYMYGKIITNCGYEVDVFNPSGMVNSVDQMMVDGLSKRLLEVIQKLRDKKKKHIQKAPRKKRPAMEETLFDNTEQADVVHSMSFADCGDADMDLPSDMMDKINIVSEERRRKGLLKSNAPAVIPDTTERSVHPLIPFQDGEEVQAEQLVKPMFSVFIEPFLHHTCPQALLQALPESAFWKHRMESMGYDTSRYVLPVRPQPHLLRVPRTPYPSPPTEVLQIEEAVTRGKFYGNSHAVAGWSLDRRAYKREWHENWAIGYTPHNPVPGSVPITQQESKYRAPKDIQGGDYIEPTDNPFY